MNICIDKTGTNAPAASIVGHLGTVVDPRGPAAAMRLPVITTTAFVNGAPPVPSITVAWHPNDAGCAHSGRIERQHHGSAENDSHPRMLPPLGLNVARAGLDGAVASR